MPTNRIVTKALAGLEDLLLGEGTEVQERGSSDVPITKINASNLNYNAALSIRDKLAKKPEVLLNVAAMQALATSVEAEQYVELLGYTTAGDDGGGLFWLDTSDTSSIEDGNLIFNPDVPANGRWKRISITRREELTESLYSESLVKLIHPDESKGLQDLQRQGVYPVSFNQQWGGMGYGGLPDGTLGEVATDSINVSSAQTVGAATGNTYVSTGFKVGQTTEIASVWIKVYKVGNPANNLQLFIYSNTGSEPDALITNGTATAQSGKLHTDNTDGEWVKFTFAIAPNIVGGTQYHIVVKSSGAVDASNYWIWMFGAANYPHGGRGFADGTPTWTTVAGNSHGFIVQPATTILQSGLSGFDGALHCYEGAPLDQSGAFYFANTELNHKRGLIHFAGTGFTKDKTIYDSGLGSDNNRIVIRCNVTTGFAQVDLYENDENKLTVTGITDISSGNRIVSIGYRAEGDGSDFLTLYIDGASEGTPLTSQTITLDRAFEDGYTTIGGGFPLAPTWTDNQDMSVLPSADGWTWTGTATEANAMVVDGGILYQNGAGYSATHSGYYAKTTTLNNATGYIVETKIQVSNASNDIADNSVRLSINDGTRSFVFDFREYYVEEANDQLYAQIDLKSKPVTFKFIIKGNDYYVFADGRLLIDGTGLNITVSGSNNIQFGDMDTTSSENSTAQWHYLKYYEGAYLPEYSDVQISEQCNWNDDKSALLSTIYNSGTIQSVKTLAGMSENYVKAEKQVISVKGITSSPTTTSTSLVPLADMSLFCFGVFPNATFNYTAYCTGAVNGLSTNILLDGAENDPLENRTNFYTTGKTAPQSNMNPTIVNEGLHYVNTSWKVTNNTGVSNTTQRILKVEAE